MPKMDPFCTMSVSRMLWRTHDEPPRWMQKLVVPDLPPSMLDHSSYNTLKPSGSSKVTLPSRDGKTSERRLLEVELPLRSVQEAYDFHNGYLTCWMPRDDQMIIVDFWPTW